MLLGLCSIASAQSSSLSPEDRERFKRDARRIADCILTERDYVRLQKDSLKLTREIAAKDSLINSLNDQVEDYRYKVQLLASREEANEATIKHLEGEAKKPGKPRRWGIGPVSGYGVSGTGLNTFVGIAIQYSIIRF